MVTSMEADMLTRFFKLGQDMNVSVYNEPE